MKRVGAAQSAMDRDRGLSLRTEAVFIGRAARSVSIVVPNGAVGRIEKHLASTKLSAYLQEVHHSKHAEWFFEAVPGSRKSSASQLPLII